MRSFLRLMLQVAFSFICSWSVVELSAGAVVSFMVFCFGKSLFRYILSISMSISFLTKRSPKSLKVAKVLTGSPLAS